MVVMVNTKKCRLCGNDFPATLEYFHKGSRGRLSSYCKPCAGAKASAWHREHRDLNLARFAEYRAKHRDRIYAQIRALRQADPGKKKVADRAWRLANLDHAREQGRKRYRRDKQSYVQRALRWARANPAKASAYTRVKSYRRRMAAPDAEARAYIPLLMSDPCSYCGSTEEIVIDHIHPISKGGQSTVENLTAACRRCNAAKTDKSLLFYLLERSKS